jgi:hypothetical protein
MDRQTTNREQLKYLNDTHNKLEKKTMPELWKLAGLKTKEERKGFTKDKLIDKILFLNK